MNNTELIPISQLETALSRQQIVSLCQAGRITGEKRRVFNVVRWLVSQSSLTDYETKMRELGKAKHGIRYAEPQ